jgi:tripartite-type tricarboxylate transporter receptor subunit TctC
MTDLLAGQVQAIFTGAPAVMPFVKSGRIRALAVSSPHRLGSLPQLPTVAESGLKELAGFEADQWYGIVAPAGTPAAVVARLNAQINASLQAPVLKTHLQSEGAEATPTTPQAFGELIARELERWRPVVKAGGIKPA